MSKTIKATALAVTAAVGVSLVPHGSARFKAAAPPVAAISPSPAIEKAAAAVEAVDEANPLLTPEATGVSAAQLARTSPAVESALAEELHRMQTRDPKELVSVIAAAAGEASPFPPTYMLAIAFAETRGKVLAVSPAGAAGLAQATPAAFLMEGLPGKLYITNDYLVGTRAYIMKKPLGDAMTISARVFKRDTPANRREAYRLVKKAKELRRVGIEELEALAPRAPKVFMERVEAADRYNLATLEELERMLKTGASSARLKKFHSRVNREYSALMKVQQITWKRYAKSLENERDRVLRQEFGANPVQVIRNQPYEAGEVLARKVDVRFSPTEMATFLSAHLKTKQQQAIALGIPDDEIEQWTAALYNGGLVNVSRLRAGLLGSLKETENYMRKVPAMKRQLDEIIAVAGG
jgi:hypothetical protein